MITLKCAIDRVPKFMVDSDFLNQTVIRDSITFIKGFDDKDVTLEIYQGKNDCVSHIQGEEIKI